MRSPGRRHLKTKGNKQNIAKRLAIICLLFRGCPSPDYDCAFYEKWLISLLVWGRGRNVRREQGKPQRGSQAHPLPVLQASGLGLRRILQVNEVWHSDSYSVLDVFGLDY